jgi:hypothetical protein
MSCGAEMRVVQSDHDETMMVAGYVHQKLECPVCHEIEERMVFDRDDTPAEPPPSDARAEPPPADIGPATLAVIEDERELDECEAMLQNAMDMVKSPAISPHEGGLTARPQSARSLRAKIAGPSRFVRIRHEPGNIPPYVAEDTRTGMTILRYQDSKHLREMCEWMGWQVIDDQIDDQVPSSGT